MRPVSDRRFLAIYSAVLTAAFAIMVFGGFTTSHKTTFDEIDVRRVNIVEPDGTLRMVISDKAEFPGSFFNRKEIPRPERQATGMLFLNDEGTEMGGLIYYGLKDKSGTIESGGHLSFDQYMQDQVFSVDAGQDGSKHYSLISIADRGDYPITEALEASKRIQTLAADQQQAEWKKFAESHPGDASRIVFGRANDASAVLKMRDRQGRDRLLIQVGADGSPVIILLNEEGKVISQLPGPK